MRTSAVEFNTRGRSKRADLRACDDMIGSRSDGLLAVAFDGLAVFSVV